MIIIKLLIGIISTSLIGLILYIIGRTVIFITDPETKHPGIADCLLASILGVMLIVGAIAVCGILTVVGHVVLERVF
jgi:hypothetical protein